MNRLHAVLFDVDGVLLDSLPPHLKICEDKNKEYKLGLQIPSAAQFKKMVHAGTRISPMKYFFTAVGFPDEFAEKANLQYQKVFSQDYAPRPFSGMHETLKALRDDGLELGIVTSNVKDNIVEALGKSVELFRVDCIFSKEDLVNGSKSEAIKRAVTRLQMNALEVVYVGDQPADWEAANAAGVNFLGVAYGWGISEQDKNFPVVTNISQIYNYIHEKEFDPFRIVQTR